MDGVFRKSTVCGQIECVEVAATEAGVRVRDSKQPGGPVLDFTWSEWDAFVAGVRLGEFDDD